MEGMKSMKNWMVWKTAEGRITMEGIENIEKKAGCLSFITSCASW
jgi:hypothetical protein